MRDGAIMANSGHFDAELDLAALREMAEGHVREVRENVQEFDLGGKKLHLIAEGRLVNLGAAEGHPAAVMDMSFANQALSAEYVAQHHAELEPKVYVVPEAIDAEVARLKLAALGIELEPMTAEQADVRRVLAARDLSRPSTTRRAATGRAIAADRPARPPREVDSRPTAAPYGTWASPIRVEDLVADIVRLAEPWLDGDDVYWLEGRPTEAGRRVLVRHGRRRHDDRPDARRRSTSARGSTSTAAASYTVAGGTVVFSNFVDGRLYRLDPGPTSRCRSRPRDRGATPTCASTRAGGASSRSARTTSGDRASHAGDASSTCPRRRRAPRVLVSGPDFLAAPRPLARRRPARLARVGPPGHALGRDAGCDGRPVAEDGSLGPPELVAGGRRTRSASPSGRPTASSTSSATAAAGGTCTGSPTGRASSRWPRWRPSSPTRTGSSTASSYGFLPDGSIVAVARVRVAATGSSTSSLGGSSARSSRPSPSSRALRVGDRGAIVVARGRARPTAAVVVALDPATLGAVGHPAPRADT